MLWCDLFHHSPSSRSQSKMSLLLAAFAAWFILATACAMVQANVLFHFALNFQVKQPENSEELVNKTIIVQNNSMSLQDNESSTYAPVSLWSEQNEYNELALQKLRECKRSVQQLNAELTPLVGRSNVLAATLKQNLRFLHEVDASLENPLKLEQHVEVMRKYLNLVDKLREPSFHKAGVRSLEYVLLKLALEKYELLDKRQEVIEYLQRAEAAWTRYKNTQVLLLENST